MPNPHPHPNRKPHPNLLPRDRIRCAEDRDERDERGVGGELHVAQPERGRLAPLEHLAREIWARSTGCVGR